MANLMKISGPARALLLLAALLAAGARADTVTTRECAARGVLRRVRQYPVDSDASFLDMGSCRLTSIPQNQRSGMPALIVLWLSWNELRELPVFEQHVCANLTGLFLHQNELTAIYDAKIFSACTKLERLDLSNNHIEVINTFVFAALTNLRDLQLQGNLIRYIPVQLLASNDKLRYLHIGVNRITHLPPEFASSLKRAGAGLDGFGFYDNPWHCACLIELLADVRRAGVGDYHYFTNYYTGRVSVCVYMDAAPCYRHESTGLRGRGGR